LDIMAAASRGAITGYGGQLTHFSPLTRDRERELALRWRQDRDEAAADELVKAHLRYVVATALKFRRYGIPLDELIAEGSFGVVHALGKFDPDRGTRFVTYAAYWIRAYILNYVLRSWSLVGSGAGALRSKNFFRLRRERARVFNLFTDETQAQEELAKRLEVPVPQLVAMLERLDTRDVSLDSQLFDGSNSRLLDTLVSDVADQEVSMADDEAKSGRAEAVRSAIVKLDARERFIVESRMMADRDDELSLAEIGRRLGVSRERARQLEARAKGKLRALLGRDLPESELAKADLSHPELGDDDLGHDELGRSIPAGSPIPGSPIAGSPIAGSPIASSPIASSSIAAGSPDNDAASSRRAPLPAGASLGAAQARRCA
jgi:RNA polymerase sigma-32 factor